jgi:hypothetical protein
MMLRHRRKVPVAAVLLSLSCLTTACGVRAYTLEIPQRTIAPRNLDPRRVAVIIDKQFMPYKIKYKYWSSPNFTWPFEGLPDSFVKTLRLYFVSVKPHAGRSIPDEYDLVARMSVDQLHFDGANTTIGDDRVDLAMTFTIERPDGTKVFERTVSASASSPYGQRCALCKPDPPEAFPQVFRQAFAELAETLNESDIRFAQRDEP